MNDLISRQDALDWCKKDDWGTPDERWRPESEYGRYIESLPTAEPQITECEHCLAYDPFENGVDGFCRKMGKVMCGSDFCSYAERRQE